MSLFNNPAINRMKSEMSEADKKGFQEMGKYMYGNVDFENGGINNALEEAYAHLCGALRSGLLLEDLDEDEREIMHDFEGDDWELNWIDDPDVSIEDRSLDFYKEFSVDPKKQEGYDRMVGDV